jgi:hypothetical protein
MSTVRSPSLATSRNPSRSYIATEPVYCGRFAPGTTSGKDSTIPPPRLRMLATAAESATCESPSPRRCLSTKMQEILQRGPVPPGAPVSSKRACGRTGGSPSQAHAGTKRSGRPRRTPGGRGFFLVPPPGTRGAGPRSSPSTASRCTGGMCTSIPLARPCAWRIASRSPARSPTSVPSRRMPTVFASLNDADHTGQRLFGQNTIRRAPRSDPRGYHGPGIGAMGLSFAFQH